MRLIKIKTTPYTDAELIELFKTSNDALDIIYRRHKEYCLNFMRAMYNDYDAVRDIYQDAVIVLYENLNKTDFKLSCSIQTYLNSICRNQILVRLKHTSKYEIKDSEANNDYIENISDWFETVDVYSR